MTTQEEYIRQSNNLSIPENHIAYLRSLKASGFSPKVIYDIGANLLCWTRLVRRLWPDAQIFLFEAFDKLEFLYKREGYVYHIGLLSNVDGDEVKFYYNDDFPGGNSYYKEHDDNVFPEDRYSVLKTERLDSVVARLGLPPPDLVKIDVQGADRDVFEGGQTTIGHAEQLIVKCQKIYYNLGAPLVRETIPVIESRGWKCIAPLFCDNGPDGNYGFINVVKTKDKQPTLCLNMIVKNESHIIAKTLEMLCAKLRFDYWVICDTGSTDDTPAIITQFFETRGIPGELHHNIWKDFAHNRTLALERAFQKTDLLLIFDADDELHGELELPTRVLFDEYRMKFGGGSAYSRTLLINNRSKPFKFVSVLHEIIVCKEPGATTTTLEGDYYVVSGRGGARSKNPNKYLDDALMLENAYTETKAVDDHIYKRYSFYCANSYKDAGKYAEAIKWYKTTLTQDNWSQEKYMCCLSLYDCYSSLDQRETGFYYLVESFKYDSERAECLHHLISHYSCTEQLNVAMSYYNLSKKLFDQIHGNTFVLEEKLFASTSDHYFYVPYLMTIVAERTREYAVGIQMYEIIFDRKMDIPSDFHIRNLVYNLQFFLGYLDKKEGLAAPFFAKMNSYLTFLNQKNHIITGVDDLLCRFERCYGLDASLVLPPRKKPSTEECIASRNILIFTGFAAPHWNRSYMLEHSLGGSEKAVIFIADELAARGYTVYVTGDILDEKTETGVTYIHMDRFSAFDIPFHTVIVSRYLLFLERFPRVSYHRLCIWAHDVCLFHYGTAFSNAEDIIARWHNVIDGCVCLTDWHRQSFESKYPQLLGKIRVINNGIQPDQIRVSTATSLVLNQKRKNKFIYTSATERGLKILLDLWPQILCALHDAELVISSYNTFPRDKEEEEMARIIATYPGSIKHLGKLAPPELYAQMRSAEYWLYPCIFPETSCITAMEMLAAEVICLYYPIAGLTHTMAECGVQIEKGNELATLLSLSEERKAEMRSQGLQYVLDNCTWSKRADMWVTQVFE